MRNKWRGRRRTRRWKRRSHGNIVHDLNILENSVTSLPRGARRGHKAGRRPEFSICYEETALPPLLWGRSACLPSCVNRISFPQQAPSYRSQWRRSSLEKIVILIFSFCSGRTKRTQRYAGNLKRYLSIFLCNDRKKSRCKNHKKG